ncbi:MAG: oligosaccharyltransferase subunit Stt3 [Amphiamblys sp. WSBS2006]|nr:MAG: oligosaccharyltransferase subunit Stt3 [Amphiamblys sp. WSBS2006]
MENTALCGVLLFCFLVRIWPALTRGLELTDYDPCFNYRATKYLLEHGLLQLLSWRDGTVWYPEGRDVWRTLYPGLMVCGCVLRFLLRRVLFIDATLKEACVVLPPVFGVLSVHGVYLIGCVLKNRGSGLCAAFLLSCLPGYIDKTLAGRYDNESVGLCFMIYSIYFWLCGIQRDSVLFPLAAGFFYFLMAVSWGGHVFLLNLVCVSVLCAMLAGRCGKSIRRRYTVFVLAGHVFFVLVPVLRAKMFRGGVYVPSLSLLCVLFLKDMRRYSWEAEFVSFVGGVSSPCFSIERRFAFLWRVFSREKGALAEYISENEKASVASFFVDTTFVGFLWPVCLWVLREDRSEEGVFVFCYTVCSFWGACMMVRLLCLFSPAVCILCGVAFSRVFSRRRFLCLFSGILVFHSVFVTWKFYSRTRMCIAGFDSGGRKVDIKDMKEGLVWLRNSTETGSRVFAWWEHGYHISEISQRATYADNSTVDEERVRKIAEIFLSSEDCAHEELRRMQADYVFVVTGRELNIRKDCLGQIETMRILSGKKTKTSDTLLYRLSSGSTKHFSPCFRSRNGFVRIYGVRDDWAEENQVCVKRGGC